MTPKRDPWYRKWAVPAVMAGVLAGGVGIGLTIGLFAATPASVPVPPSQPRGIAQPTPVTPSPPPDAESEAPPATPPPRPGEDEKTELAAVPLILPQPSVDAASPNAPAWMRHAVSVPRSNGRPMIAVIIDDMGVDKRRSLRMASLRAPLTLSFLTYAEDGARQAAIARARGHELMVHVPMQPQGEAYDPGPDVLETQQPVAEMRRRLVEGLNRFDNFVGINNHMGSRFTADRAGMRVVMEELSKRGLLWIDSLTTEKSVGPDLARRYGVASASRHVFLDNEPDIKAIEGQLGKLEAQARRNGSAIAIGHPHDPTIQALAAWLPGLEARGFVLVPVSAIVREHSPGG